MSLNESRVFWQRTSLVILVWFHSTGVTSHCARAAARHHDVGLCTVMRSQLYNIHTILIEHLHLFMNLVPLSQEAAAFQILQNDRILNMTQNRRSLAISYGSKMGIEWSRFW